jgi:hypothetical protein
MRQFPLTRTDHVFDRLPDKPCKYSPGKSISLADVDAFKRPSIKRILSACFAWIPDLTPRRKNFSSPLCLKLLIMKFNVTYVVTGVNLHSILESARFNATRPAKLTAVFLQGYPWHFAFARFGRYKSRITRHHNGEVHGTLHKRCQ